MVQQENVPSTVCQNPDTSLGIVGSQHQFKQRDVNAGMACHVIFREALFPGTLLPQEYVVYVTMKYKKKEQEKKIEYLAETKRKETSQLLISPKFFVLI